jgi:hypothetical protein
VIGSLSALLLGFASGPVEPTGPVRVLQNAAIDAQTRAEIESLNSQLLDGFARDDASAMRELFAEEVLTAIESGPGLDQLFAQVRGALAGTTPAPYHEFDITLAEPREEVLEVPADGDDGFQLSLQPRGTRMYVSLVEAKAGFRDQLMGFVYTRPTPPGDAWRLDALRLGALRIDGKNAMDWYAEAEQLNELQLHLPSAMRLVVAADLLRPVPFWRYLEERAVAGLEQRVSRSLAKSHSFPLELSDVPGGPSVLRMEPVFEQQNLLTLVSYVTAGELDRSSVEAEVVKIHDVLVGLFHGLCHEAVRVAYRAYDETPSDPGKSYPSLDAVARCL